MAELLTDLEHQALEMTGQLANLLGRIIGSGPAALTDWEEAALPIHAVQHMILAQAAARAYPDRYRLLGFTLTTTSEGECVNNVPEEHT